MLEPKILPGKTSIVIGGRMYSGKTTVGKLIQAYSLRSYVVSPFAAKLKSLVHEYYGLTEEEAAFIKSDLRADYQQLGTEAVRRNYKEDFWSVLAMRSHYPYLLFDDCRYLEEIETVKKYSEKFLAIWIDCDEETRKIRCDAKYGKGTFDKQNHNHSSEVELNCDLPFWDHKINNSKDQEDLMGLTIEFIMKKFDVL